MPQTKTVPAIPFPLEESEGSSWRVDDTGSVHATADPRSDIFIDPGTPDAEPVLNAATLLGRPPAGDFQFSARMSVGFASTFDAGVLLLWIDERHWGKLCFEYSPDHKPMVVSVVNRGVSDDANAFVVEGDSVWLRVSRIDRTYAYHASLDGKKWEMIRLFALDDPESSAGIGFEAQSPTGDGCEVTFDHIRFTQDRLANLRDGS